LIATAKLVIFSELQALSGQYIDYQTKNAPQPTVGVHCFFTGTSRQKDKTTRQNIEA